MAGDIAYGVIYLIGPILFVGLVTYGIVRACNDD